MRARLRCGVSAAGGEEESGWQQEGYRGTVRIAAEESMPPQENFARGMLHMAKVAAMVSIKERWRHTGRVGVRRRANPAICTDIVPSQHTATSCHTPSLPHAVCMLKQRDRLLGRCCAFSV